MAGDLMRGDQTLRLAGRYYRLRLTMGALAQICAALDAASPQSLAGKFRTMSQADICLVLRILLRAADVREPEISEGLKAARGAELTAAAELIATLFTEGFAP